MVKPCRSAARELAQVAVAVAGAQGASDIQQPAARNVRLRLPSHLRRPRSATIRISPAVSSTRAVIDIDSK
jgi:hypothetical protein